MRGHHTPSLLPLFIATKSGESWAGHRGQKHKAKSETCAWKAGERRQGVEDGERDVCMGSKGAQAGCRGQRRSANTFDPFSLDMWDPFQVFGDFRPSKEVSVVASTQIDWKETADAHIFKADLPGLKKEEVKIEVEEGRILQISGERSKEEEEKNDKWHRIERSRGSFLRRFRLPENAKADEIKAAMENGVLTVTVPKQPQPKPQVKSIEISG
eukprot:Gb_22137 [translate_table: standard]